MDANTQSSEAATSFYPACQAKRQPNGFGSLTDYKLSGLKCQRFSARYVMFF